MICDLSKKYKVNIEEEKEDFKGEKVNKKIYEYDMADNLGQKIVTTLQSVYEQLPSRQVVKEVMTNTIDITTENTKYYSYEFYKILCEVYDNRGEFVDLFNSIIFTRDNRY